MRLKRTVEVSLMVMLCASSLVSPGVAQEAQPFSVLKFIANQVQLRGKTVEVRGSSSCSREDFCEINGDGFTVYFSAVKLSENDRIELLKRHNNPQPKPDAVVTIVVGPTNDSLGTEATAVRFQS